MRMRHAFDKSVEATVAAGRRSYGRRGTIQIAAEYLREMRAHVSMAQAEGAQSKETERLHERERATILTTQNKRSSSPIAIIGSKWPRRRKDARLWLEAPLATSPGLGSSAASKSQRPS